MVVPTFGDPHWVSLAQARAIPSAQRLGVPVVTVHTASLCQARNEGLTHVDTEWVIYLDADDELEPGYVTAMAAASADVRAPAVRYLQGSAPGPARLPKVAGHTHDCHAECLIYGNWLVIGSAVRADLVRAVGGWRDFTWSEDWDLWLRCHLAGATFEAVPDAVYRAWVRPNSRNRAPSRQDKWLAHQAIAEANGVSMP